jgi:hypothetical protein
VGGTAAARTTSNVKNAQVDADIKGTHGCADNGSQEEVHGMSSNQRGTTLVAPDHGVPAVAGELPRGGNVAEQAVPTVDGSLTGTAHGRGDTR